MESVIGENLTLWTVRLAVACYLLRLSIDISGWRSRRSNRIACRLWTAGCVFFLAHVICAFHFYHAWSHFAAYERTARQTAETVGIDWGGGLYFNYVFIGIWIGDVTAWWRQGETYIERRRIYWSIQAIFALMIVNATIVFGPPYWKWIALSAAASLLLVRIIFERRRAGR